MTREEAIQIVREADGPKGTLVGQRLDWAHALVLSLELLGLIKFEESEKEEDDV